MKPGVKKPTLGPTFPLENGKRTFEERLRNMFASVDTCRVAVSVRRLMF